VINGIWIGSVAHTSARIRILTGTRSAAQPRRRRPVRRRGRQEEPRPRPPLRRPRRRRLCRPVRQPARPRRHHQPARHPPRPQQGVQDPAPSAAPLRPDRRRARRPRRLRRPARRGRAPRRHRPDPRPPRRLPHQPRPRRRPARQRRAARPAVGRATTLAQQGELAIALFAAASRPRPTSTRASTGTPTTTSPTRAPATSSCSPSCSAISRRLEQTGLLARTTVAVLSEFTRTPKLNKQPEPGKDHWPLTSALVFGGTSRPGRYGTTDDGLGAVPVRMDDGTASDSGRLLQFDNFAAGLLTHLGVPHSPWIPTWSRSVARSLDLTSPRRRSPPSSCATRPRPPALAAPATPRRRPPARRSARRSARREGQTREARQAREGRQAHAAPDKPRRTSPRRPPPSAPSAPLPACPQDNTLTWRSFGAGFLLTWCTGCHSSHLAADARQDAPIDVNFDTHAAFKPHAGLVYERAVLEAHAFLRDPNMPPAGLPPRRCPPPASRPDADRQRARPVDRLRRPARPRDPPAARPPVPPRVPSAGLRSTLTTRSGARRFLSPLNAMPVSAPTALTAGSLPSARPPARVACEWRPPVVMQWIACPFDSS
jgi:hypothetical protein